MAGPDEMDQPRIPPKSPDSDALGFRPLYRQVRDVLVKRIVDNVWQPGELLPSEFEIAGDLGVSQGTIRKALDELETEKFIVRRQGKGTYVARHDDARILFQFFKLVPDSGKSEFPESQILDVTVEAADAEAAAALGLAANARVVRIERLRSLGSQVCIIERITAAARAVSPASRSATCPTISTSSTARTSASPWCALPRSSRRSLPAGAKPSISA